MRTNHFAVTLSLTLAAVGCVESETDLATVTQAVCTGTTSATAPMPTATVWTGQLPGDVQGAAAQQVWMVTPNNNPVVLPLNTFTLYLVDTVGKKVVWRSTLTPAQRTKVVGQIAARNGVVLLGRQPPTPPFPPIDLGVWADLVVDDAFVTRSALEE